MSRYSEKVKTINACVMFYPIDYLSIEMVWPRGEDRRRKISNGMVVFIILYYKADLCTFLWERFALKYVFFMHHIGYSPMNQMK